MVPVSPATACVCFLPLTVAVTAAGGAVSLGFRSGQGTPRSGRGASGALGSSSAASGGAGAGGAGACCAAWEKAGEASTTAPAAHSSRAAYSLEPRPIIKREALPSAPEPRQYEKRSLSGGQT